MPHYIITKTTVETLGIDSESLASANTSAQQGLGQTMTINTTINVRPRPETPVRTNPQVVPSGFPGHVPFGRAQAQG